MSAKDWAKSLMYRKGHAAGVAEGYERGRADSWVIRIRLQDGRVLHRQDVIDELARVGLQLVPLCRCVEPSENPDLGEADAA